MTYFDNQNGGQPTERRSRSRRSERSQQLFEARTFPAMMPAEDQYQQPAAGAASGQDTPASAYSREAEPVSYVGYTPNEVRQYTDETFQQTRRTRRRVRYEQAVDSETPALAEEISFSFIGDSQPPAENWAAYRRPDLQVESLEEVQEDQFAYAPPVKLSFSGYENAQHFEQETPLQQETGTEYGTANVYRPRVMDYNLGIEDAAEETLPTEGYQVKEEEHPPKKKKKGGIFVALTALALAVAAAFLFLPDQLSGIVARLTGKAPETTESVAVAPTPPPVKSYDPATPVQISSVTGSAISQISGTTEMQPHVVMETSLMTRNPRGNNEFDFYLFNAKDGRLLAYFEKLGRYDAFPMADGGYYVRQSPYLIDEDGSAMIPQSSIAPQVEGEWTLHPMMNGWSRITENATGKVNLINREGQMLNRFWMERLWPMTGNMTVGYVDTGNAADAEGRYSLYVMSSEGECTKWRSEGGMDSVVGSACGAAYMTDGGLYLLSDTENPLLVTDEVMIYVDCQAMVIKDSATGKYALYVQGTQHYDFLFDEIRPVESELNWHSERFEGPCGTMTMYYVKDADYPQPLTHYFLLKSGETEEYVALSTLSGCPVVLE